MKWCYLAVETFTVTSEGCTAHMGGGGGLCCFAHAAHGVHWSLHCGSSRVAHLATSRGDWVVKGGWCQCCRGFRVFGFVTTSSTEDHLVVGTEHDSQQAAVFFAVQSNGTLHRQCQSGTCSGLWQVEPPLMCSGRSSQLANI